LSDLTKNDSSTIQTQAKYHPKATTQGKPKESKLEHQPNLCSLDERLEEGSGNRQVRFVQRDGTEQCVEADLRASYLRPYETVVTAGDKAGV
jgi:hypothetical protein